MTPAEVEARLQKFHERHERSTPNARTSIRVEVREWCAKHGQPIPSWSAIKQARAPRYARRVQGAPVKRDPCPRPTRPFNLKGAADSVAYHESFLAAVRGVR